MLRLVYLQLSYSSKASQYESADYFKAEIHSVSAYIQGVAARGQCLINLVVGVGFARGGKVGYERI